MKRNKKWLKFIILGAPVVLLPLISVSCETLNKYFLKYRKEPKDKQDPKSPSTPPETKKETPSTPPEPNSNTRNQANPIDVINNFNSIYTSPNQFDVNPQAFHAAGTFLAHIIPAKPSTPQETWKFILKHAPTIWYYSGISKYYDYILQADNLPNSVETIQKRLLKLKSGQSSYETINIEPPRTRLGIEWVNARTYDLDTIIQVFGDFYTFTSGYASMYHGIVPLERDSKETEIKKSVSDRDANWHKYREADLTEEEGSYKRISYRDMYKVSRNFYERQDRHFIQDRVKISPNDSSRERRLLSLDPVPGVAPSDYLYVNKWYNYKYPYSSLTKIDNRNYIGVFPQEYQTETKEWSPMLFYNSTLVLAPFKAILNSNVMSKGLTLLKHYVDFKIVLSMLKKDPTKTFIELLDDQTNTKLQEFYAKNNYTRGFRSLLSALIGAVSNVIDPTIYLNYINEDGKKYFFYDEWPDSYEIALHGRKDYLQPSNQRAIYTFGINLYNKFLMPLNYILNGKDEFKFINSKLYSTQDEAEIALEFKTALFNEFYKPVFGAIETLPKDANDDAKLMVARQKVKNFLENSIVKIVSAAPDSNENNHKYIQKDKNLLLIYNITSKDIESNHFNRLWLKPETTTGE
ncbi:hypothetical protein H9M94_03065 [Mycoplasma sp. Pen4]|uniref:hypothetical protein n=1 Tax=Mycoplasma sp. Pen4 TaxID=640330 RepID=UPI0016549D99|nr:hypothetical protein [Mycoplasma sp. Pen4]QNM93560.1 hypothetical protein H9M94_03065 [Mycoplasma sp. Pen4]